MSALSEFVADLPARCAEIVRRMKADPAVGPYVDDTLAVPRPFVGRGPVRLVIIGQDPTVGDADDRRAITTVLTLDQGGSLRRYVERIGAALGLILDEHVYATNVCKNFFTRRPRTVPGLVEQSSLYWLPLLREELALVPSAVVMALGEPVLRTLVGREFAREMRSYWGYHPYWRAGRRNPFRTVPADESSIARPLFPMVHEPALADPFYAQRFNDYLAFVRKSLPEPRP